ncbi:MAG TPA: anti-sigma factor family protein [Xenococcaceae cyanobacterium]
MTSNYGDLPDYQQLETNDSQPDYFELLSAYIDDEVTPQERQQVQQWLDNDPEIKQVYLQLLSLQNEIQALSVPASAVVPPETVAKNVFVTLDRTRNYRKILVWGGGAIAATMVATLSGLLPGLNSSSLRLADAINQRIRTEEPVLVAVTLNQPAVKIPKTAVSSSTSATSVESEF